LGRKKEKEVIEEKHPPIRSKREALEAYRELLGRLLRLYELWGKDIEREIAWIEKGMQTAEE